MAIDPRTGERVYATIKQWILSGDLRLRQRLDIDTLAERLGASATPVRQALTTLSAERLVTAHPSRGYYVAFWSERELRTLYQWRSQLAVLAVDSFEPSAAEPKPKGSTLEVYHAIMRRLERAANDELKRAAQNADERLRAAYVAEAEEIADLVEQLKRLCGAIQSGERRRMVRVVKAYFKQRMDTVPALRTRAGVAALPRNGDA